MWGIQEVGQWVQRHIAETISAIWDFTAGLKTNTISESTADTGVTCDGVLLKDGNIKGNNLNIKPYSGEVIDNGTIVLPASSKGKIWIKSDSDSQSIEAEFSSAGAITFVRKTVNFKVTESDGYHCLYNNGGIVTYKNMTGGALTVQLKADFA